MRVSKKSTKGEGEEYVYLCKDKNVIEQEQEPLLLDLSSLLVVVHIKANVPFKTEPSLCVDQILKRRYIS